MQKILFWRWKEPDPTGDELDHVSPHKPDKAGREHKMREFLVKWHEMSFWHCEWISEIQVRTRACCGGILCVDWCNRYRSVLTTLISGVKTRL